MRWLLKQNFGYANFPCWNFLSHPVICHFSVYNKGNLRSGFRENDANFEFRSALRGARNFLELSCFLTPLYIN
jgi:hypothetical protein